MKSLLALILISVGLVCSAADINLPTNERPINAQLHGQSYKVSWPLQEPKPAPVPKVKPAKPASHEILAFTMNGCGPCLQMKTEWKVLEKRGYKVTYIHENKKLADKWNVARYPTTICLKDGKEVGRNQGYVPAVVIARHYGPTKVRPRL